MKMTFRTDQKARPTITVLWLLLLLLVPTVALAQGHKAKQEKSGAPRQVKQYSIEQFLGTTKITGSSFSSDDKSILFSSNKTGIFNVYSIPVSGGEPKQLTHSTTESTFAISYFPDDSRVLFTHDQERQ
jgi:hypothetical protein